MYVTLRGRIALVGALSLALVLGLGTAAAAQETPAPPSSEPPAAPVTEPPAAPPTEPPTTPAPAPTAPLPWPRPGAPVPFELPSDVGYLFLAQRDAARADLAIALPALGAVQARHAELQTRFDAMTAELGRLDESTRAAMKKLDESRQRLEDAAVEAYRRGNGSSVDAALKTVMSAQNVVDMGRDMHLIDVYGNHEEDLLQQFEAAKKALDGQVADLSDERARVQGELEQAIADLAGAEAATVDAGTRIMAAEHGIEEFHLHATASTSPILGPSRLTAPQLVAFITAQGYQTHITVPIEELAQLYLEEGELAGVRGDVAWAQSILETGGFSFPGGGQLDGNDNNFAGIGACDSCAHGFRFDDAREGVRAQMQALRIYCDKEMGLDTLPVPLVMPKMLNLGFRGKVKSWWDLWGTWATGDLYGQRVYDIYERMVAEAPPDPPPVPPAPEPAP